MAGPFPTKKQADEFHGEAVKISAEIDGYPWMMDWPTIRVSENYGPGRLNERLGITEKG